MNNKTDDEIFDRMNEILEECGDTSIMNYWDRPKEMREYDELYDEAVKRNLI